MNTPNNQVSNFSIFVLGFRPFFLAVGIFSFISMLLWLAMYQFGMMISLGRLASHYWHAHEMLYGFTMAAISGFLLTAIKNWTGEQTIQNYPLLILLLMWLAARICMLIGSDFYIGAAVFDLSFNLYLFIAVLQPIAKAKQWRQAGIVSKIFLLAVFNALFYLGLFGIVNNGIYWGIYGGTFLLLALILTIGRRVLPFFISKGIDDPVEIKNSTFLDLTLLITFLAFSITEVFIKDRTLSSYLAGGLFVLSSVRLYNWHTKQIWSVPLLWGLYSAFVFITLGFLLFALIPYIDVLTPSLALHSITIGGFGLMTLSMMSRVTLGHTGRGVKQASRWLAIAQWLLLLGVICRVFLPLFAGGFYTQLVFIAQLLWLVSFALFVGINYPLLTKPRVDGASG
ncbi:MAG: NnrS family protein [Piscirickettsiaceae bacterium]|nr:MAG: NnrS family protein [Piscirickettsiaceae bacterium]